MTLIYFYSGPGLSLGSLAFSLMWIKVSDLGEAAGSGAHLDALRRTRSGGFRVEEALSVEDALRLLS